MQSTQVAPTGGGEVVLGRYRLVRRLGGGGFGVVWLAEDCKLGRHVAVKRIPAGDPDIARRAAREGKIAAQLQHPAIVALHETGADEEAAYLVSEVVHGETYAALLEQGELSDRAVVEIGLALCNALTHAHRKGVIHRDVKPQNVLVPDGPDGGPPAKLTDFGIARIAGDDALTRTGDVVGTLAYMAPEQAEGGEVGPEADVYALGLCLYEGLAGVNPIKARGAGATARRVGSRLPPLGRLRRDLPPALCDAVDAAVWPDPAERGTLADLRAALRDARDGVDDEPGTIAGAPLEPLAGGLGVERTAPPARVAAALLAGAGVGAAAGLVGPAEAVWWWFALGTAALVALLPRIGWIAGAAAIIVLAASGPGLAGTPAQRPGDVVWVLAAALAPVPLLLRRAAVPAWTVGAVAPLAGLVGLAGMFPAAAGQLRGPLHRAALGALGAWWTLLAEHLLDRRLLWAPSHETGAAAVAAVATSPEVAVVGVWAVAAAVLPYVVRGRVLAVDVVAATAWAAAAGAATQAVAGAAPYGLIPGAMASGALAVGLAASRGSAAGR